LKKFNANSVFRASASCSKILNDNKYLNVVKNFRASPVVQGKHKLFKILNNKKYIFNTVNSGHTLFFRASASCSKILNVKSIQGKFSGQTLFSGKAQSCSKILKDEKYFNEVKNFRANSVFQGKRKLFKILNNTNIYSMQ